MSNIREIFSSRIKKEQDKRSSYNKYIFNSHLVMFLLIIAGAVMLNYSKWLANATIMQRKIVLLVILTVLGYILASLKIKTFIKEADTIFLLPLENKYKDLERSIVVPTLIVKIFIAIFFLAISYPIIGSLAYSSTKLVSYCAVLITFIALTTGLKYRLVVYESLENKVIFYIFTLYILSNVTFVFTTAPFLIIAPLLMTTFYFYTRKNLSNNINWYGAAEYDNARMEKYLKFINMFVDVPINITKVARRKYLDIFLPKLTKAKFNSDYAYKYYYLRAFFRQENTIFLVLRLMLVAAVIIYSFNNVIVSFIVILAYNYLVIIQVLPFYKKINNSLWANILPVSEEVKLKNFSQTILMLIFITSFLLLIFASILIALSGDDRFLAWLPTAPPLGNLINMYFINKLKK